MARHPGGERFLSVGINHLHAAWWQQDYNREAWRERLGLSDVGSDDFEHALRTWFLQTCRHMGLNTVGVHTDLHVVNQPRPAMVYMRPIDFVSIPHWKTEVPNDSFLDVFSPEFATHCDRLAKQIAAPARADPYRLAYAMTDCPLLTEEDCRERTDVIGGARREARIGWPRRLRNLGAAAPGKQAYVLTMKELYRGDIHDFNATYDTQFNSFAALASAECWRPHTDLANASETRDNVTFLQRVVAQYYQTARDAIRRYDPNRLFVGDKLNGNTDAVDTVLPITSQYTDIVFYQMYGRYEVQATRLDRWSTALDQPFINGDAAYTMITNTMPRPYGPVADDIRQRAEWTEKFFRNAFARPDFVGWHYCGLINAPNLIPARRGRQHSGLLNGYGAPYPELQRVMQACTDQVYAIALASGGPRGGFQTHR